MKIFAVQKHKSKFLACLAAVCLLICQAGIAVEFDRPAGLEKEIAFWRKVFAEVPSTKGLVHDNRHLGVVYGNIDIPAGLSTKHRQQIYDKAFVRYKKALQVLATGKRKGLTQDETHVLSLWPAKTTNREFTAAVGRLRVQQGVADRFLEGWRRSGRWMPFIHTTLARHEVPIDLAALPHVESSFDPTAYSHADAAGLWQFTRGTGKLYMSVDHVLDQRRDPYFSTEAAAKLLAANYRALGSWPLAITAYNSGVGGMKRAIKQLGTTDIARIVHEYNGGVFGFASRNFYVSFMAVRDIHNNPEKYIGNIPRDSAETRQVVTLPAYIPAAQLASALNIQLNDLRQLNPAIMPVVWEGDKRIPKQFELRLPGVEATQLLAALPAEYRFAEQTPDLEHKVKSGDTLWAIARYYDTNVRQLVAWNGLDDKHRLKIGQVLRLPVTASVASTSKTGSGACSRTC